MNQKNITILILWNDEKVIVEMDIEEFIEMQKEDLSLWEKEFYLSQLKRTISYSDIKGKQWKTQYIALSEPKKESKEPTAQERIERDKMISEMLDKTYENRRKTFLGTRKDILKQLAKSERRFKLQTTEEKLEELNILRQKAINNTN